MAKGTEKKSAVTSKIGEGKASPVPKIGKASAISKAQGAKTPKMKDIIQQKPAESGKQNKKTPAKNVFKKQEDQKPEQKQVKRPMKYVLVSGGCMSGLGKGITASSIGLILKTNGYRVTAIKIDPYLNVDAGTMSPFEHGETFVLDDGGETDLDLGNYERYLDINLNRDNNLTTGKVY